jgi:hypothetical protein
MASAAPAVPSRTELRRSCVIVSALHSPIAITKTPTTGVQRPAIKSPPATAARSSLLVRLLIGKRLRALQHRVVPVRFTA